MFLAAVARPRFDHTKKAYFDGKVGVLPFAIVQPAKRNSKNRAKGTPVVVPHFPNGEVYKKVIIDKVVPAILERFPPRALSRGVVIQQDNANPHPCVTTELLAQKGVEKIRVF
ncbi:hypothetical protein AaE_013852 [Aphanomyces astaci]|uniref:Tc1-like transposase DDE domain-containing protein n=1 Tax=Aphanomyces astaci TaxID=112090 RepID=A0A6A4Z913_APHAT|nr:hypothetical protein AaE_013852 [Aphanomyces astaci]